jgi:hypothetical protein
VTRHQRRANRDPRPRVQAVVEWLLRLAPGDLSTRETSRRYWLYRSKQDRLTALLERELAAREQYMRYRGIWSDYRTPLRDRHDEGGDDGER